jgi:prolyl oligopeptidase
MPGLRLCAATLLLAASLSATAQPAAPLTSPPAAPSVPVTELMHGVAVSDPYRNLENRSDPATREWMRAQGAYAAAVLERIDQRDAIARRIGELVKTTGDSVHSIRRMPGERI